MAYEILVLLLLFGVMVLSIAVSISDFKTRRIPNKFLLVGIVYVLLVYVTMLFFLPFTDVLKGFLFALLGAMAGGMMLYLPYKYQQVGAGDVKLVIVFGLFLGFKGVVLAILFGSMIGGVWALVLAWRHGGLGHMFYNIKYMMRSLYLSGFKEMSWDLRSKGAIAMPYGVALSAGALLIVVEQMQLYYHRLLEQGVF